jgi:glutathione synthase/RimK-type ligase-like ATP-grasp enzyme
VSTPVLPDSSGGAGEPVIALLTEARYAESAAAAGDWYLRNILEDDRILAEALKREGFNSERVDWARHDVNWSGFRGAFFRTTWDYVERIDAFRAWLARVDRVTSLLNPRSLVEWSLDKHYLGALAARGVPTVPSRFLDRGWTNSLGELMEMEGWHEAVIKPCISATAYMTFRFTKETAPATEEALGALRTQEDFILQPFLPSVMTEGEVTLVLVDGSVTHGVRKVPKAGDFRVQDDFGGTVHPHDPSPDEVQVAVAAVAASGMWPGAEAPLYARVDLVRDSTGSPRVMELELIEPELWIRLNPGVADQLAQGIRRRLGDA